MSQLHSALPGSPSAVVGPAEGAEAGAEEEGHGPLEVPCPLRGLPLLASPSGALAMQPEGLFESPGYKQRQQERVTAGLERFEVSPQA